MKKVLKKFVPKPLWHKAESIYINLLHFVDGVYYCLAIAWHTLGNDYDKLYRVTLVSKCQPFSMLDRKGLFTTYDLALDSNVKEIAGCFVECGVASGGCGALMAHLAEYRKTYLFDSYEGLPPPKDIDTVSEYKTKDRHGATLAEGYCLGTLEEVEQMLFDYFKLDRDKVFCVKGWFENTLPEYRYKIGKIAFLKLDADWYESVKCVLENLWDNISEGGYVYVDDFHLKGCQKAVLEFLQSRNIDPVLISDCRGGIWFKK